MRRRVRLVHVSLRGAVHRIAPPVLLAAWVLVLLGGCAERRYPVEGVVKYRGESEPAKDREGGVVAFTTPDLKYSSTGIIDSDGRFSLTSLDTYKGAPAGRYKVAVVNPHMEPGERARRRRIVDPKYGSSGTTPIEVDVTPNGPNQFEIVVNPGR